MKSNQIRSNIKKNFKPPMSHHQDDSLDEISDDEKSEDLLFSFTSSKTKCYEGMPKLNDEHPVPTF